MKLYFNYTQCFVIAQHDGHTYDMRTGKVSDEKCQSRLDAYSKCTTSKWMTMDITKLARLSDEGISISSDTFSLLIDGHLISGSLNNTGQVQLTGNFPRYFWKGLEALVNT